MIQLLQRHWPCYMKLNTQASVSYDPVFHSYSQSCSVSESGLHFRQADWRLTLELSFQSKLVSNPCHSSCFSLFLFVFFKDLYYLMHMSSLCAHMSMCHLCAWCSRQSEDFRPLYLETSSYPVGGGSDLGPLQQHQVLFSTEPPLQPLSPTVARTSL